MFTLAYIYILFYACILIYLGLFFTILLGISPSLSTPLPLIIRFIKTYSSYFYIFSFLVLSLSGLPPLFLFYPKVFLWTQCAGDFSIYIVLILVIYFILLTLYYLQVFNTTEDDFVFIRKFIKFIPRYAYKLQTYSRYYLVYMLMWFIFLNLCGIFIGLDIFLIMSNLA